LIVNHHEDAEPIVATFQLKEDVEMLDDVAESEFGSSDLANKSFFY
jgi:hypothetical protein